MCTALHCCCKNRPTGWPGPPPTSTRSTAGQSGNAVLVGDAAHATLPHLAQGAAMALEDAVELAAQVGDGNANLAASLSRFEALRKPRTSRVTLGSRAQGSIYKMTGPSALARNLVMKLMPASRQLERLAWIYEG
jgi:salicylate hydroxylase